MININIIKKPLFILISLFLILTICTMFNVFDSIDLFVASIFYNIRGNKFGFIYYFFKIITEFGFVYIVLIIMTIMIFVFKDRRSIYMIVGMISTTITNYIFKLIVNRQRPNSEYWWGHETSNSYPSGHSITAFYFYFIIMYFLLLTIKNHTLRKIIVITSYTIILLVGVSRMVLGVHYFTDIVGGFLLGGIMYNLTIYIYEKKA